MMMMMMMMIIINAVDRLLAVYNIVPHRRAIPNDNAKSQSVDQQNRAPKDAVLLNQVCWSSLKTAMIIVRLHIK